MKLAIIDARPALISALRSVLSRVSGCTVAWCATNGAEALRSLRSERVDVALLGLALPDTSAANLTRRLVAEHSFPIVLLADATPASLSEVYEAMGHGALDVAPLPSWNQHGNIDADAFLGKLRTVRRLLGHSSGELAGICGPERAEATARGTRLVAIGASTGGPQALLEILSGVPRDVPLSFVVVQHVDSEFSEGLAEWLEQGTNLRVRVARNGDEPAAGTVLVAGTRDHLVMKAGGSLGYTAEPRALVYRPSVDVLFSSLVKHWPEPSIAVLLTGMGKDGAQGMSGLRRAGWHTIAQDQATSVVYGMPKAAAELGAATRVLPLGAIARQLLALAEAPRV
ncbi:MAG TPA: chemotaxis-specific protein-glutamate methyltransferase CheB [Polyangiaceae bacterium]